MNWVIGKGLHEEIVSFLALFIFVLSSCYMLAVVLFSNLLIIRELVCQQCVILQVFVACSKRTLLQIGGNYEQRIMLSFEFKREISLGVLGVLEKSNWEQLESSTIFNTISCFYLLLSQLHISLASYNTSCIDLNHGCFTHIHTHINMTFSS